MSLPSRRPRDRPRGVRRRGDRGAGDQAVTAVLEEGEQVEHTWTAADFADSDWEHPDTRPRMRGWLHLFAFFGAIVAGAVLVPLASVLGLPGRAVGRASTA